MQQIFKSWRFYLLEHQVKQTIKEDIERIKAWRRSHRGEKYSEQAAGMNPQVIADSVLANKQYEAMGGYRFLILDSQEGAVPFYKSTGVNEPELKGPGEWVLFRGFVGSRALRYPMISKDAYTMELTNGGDDYLTKLAMSLEAADKEGLLPQEVRNFDEAGAENFQAVNEMMEEKHGPDIMFYNPETLSITYANKVLIEAGALDHDFLQQNSPFVGIDPVPSELLSEGNVIGKTLYTI